MFPVGRNQSQSEKVIESMNERSNQLSNNQRGLTREQLFAKSRGIQSKRVKIIDFSEEYVQLGEEKIAVENLGSMNDYYYVLSKRETIKQGPTITLPQTSNYLFDKIQFQQQNQQQSQPSDQDEDSNRQSNPDYDYPQEDYHDGDSEDEGVIHKDYYPGYQDQDERNQSDYQLDQEEVYRRYLKRCKNDRNRQSDDDQYY